ncbi:MAG: DHH family phosphoesterase [Candidatus Woesebacteria bacterium]|jgi:inorganic pyrophosphatase/manganese-dependent inorganic pyrophosphatase
MIVVTAGHKYLDVDGYAGCLAYAELLQLKGQDAAAVSTARLNSSIPKMLKSLDLKINTDYLPASDDRFVIVDLSDPEHFDKFVRPVKVVEIFDHHPGFEDFWRDQIGDKSKIQHVGAACTLIFEEWENAGLLDKISYESALLMACAILDNTLNFGASITTDRDHHAYQALVKVADLPDDLPQIYFAECQKLIESDIVETLNSDTKKMKLAIGQITAWDASNLITNYRDQISQTLCDIGIDWYANIISMKDRKSNILCTNEKLKKYLKNLLNVSFAGDIAVADRMWLRKEIFKEELSRGLRYLDD